VTIFYKSPSKLPEWEKFLINLGGGLIEGSGIFQKGIRVIIITLDWNPFF